MIEESRESGYAESDSGFDPDKFVCRRGQTVAQAEVIGGGGGGEGTGGRKRCRQRPYPPDRFVVDELFHRRNLIN